MESEYRTGEIPGTIYAARSIAMITIVFLQKRLKT